MIQQENYELRELIERRFLETEDSLYQMRQQLTTIANNSIQR